jgi:protein-disulfide isomerase
LNLPVSLPLDALREMTGHFRDASKESFQDIMLKTILDRATAFLVVSIVLLVWGVASAYCQNSEAAKPTDISGIISGQTASPVVALIGNVPIREDDVDKYAGHEIDELTKRLYLLRSQALSSMIDSIVIRDEAARRHVDVEQLLQSEIKAPRPPSVDEIEREWSNNYDSLKPLGEVSGHYQIVLNLDSHYRSEELRKYLDELREAHHVSILLEPPAVRLKARPGVDIIGNPAGARELVVFQDYECPFCRQLEPELNAALQKDSSLADLKVTIKQLPLPQHKGAFDAAVAAKCASEQKQFRAMHDLLIANQDHTADGLTKSASQLGLDLTKFSQCMAGDAARVQIRLDMEEARKNGVEGTPTLFLEGQQIDLPSSPKDISKALEAKSKPHQETTASNPEIPASSTR